MLHVRQRTCTQALNADCFSSLFLLFFSFLLFLVRLRLVRLLSCVAVVRMWKAQMAKGNCGSHPVFDVRPSFSYQSVDGALAISLYSHSACRHVVYLSANALVLLDSARKQCERVVPLFGFYTHRAAYGMKRTQ